jgi:hypothetical protein
MSCIVARGAPLLVLVSLCFPACADVVLYRDELIECEVISEGEDAVVMQVDGKERSIHPRYVQEIVRGQTVPEYLRARLKALGPDDVKGRLELARLANRNQQSEVADEIFREVLALDPKNAQAGRGLHYVVDDDGRYVDPAERTVVSEPTEPGADERTGPLCTFEYSEMIGKETWERFKVTHPDPGYDRAVGDLFAYHLLGKEHGWKVRPLEEKGTADPRVHARVTTQAKYLGTTTWMHQKHQAFYEATVQLELTRLRDNVVVLRLEGKARNGHHDQSKAAHGALSTAGLALIRSEQVQKAALWGNPGSAPPMEKPIVIEHRSMQHQINE